MAAMQPHAPLPDDIDALKALLAEQLDEVRALREQRLAWSAEREALQQAKHDDKNEIVRLTLLLAKLKRMLFGQKSEKLQRQIDQLELELEELHVNQGERTVMTDEAARVPTSAPVRRPLPEHLPREVIEHYPQASACPDCGSAFKRLGEDVSNVLEYVPASFKVIQHVRPKLACTCCDRIMQAPAPSRPIARGLAGPGLLAHIFVSKYADHIPLHRQCIINARDGIEISDSTMGDWVGGGHQLFAPLVSPSGIKGPGISGI
jgi:transposase